MALEPYNWNVTIAGHWNRAILTPQGIATRLFKKPAETAIEVEVPIDALGPYKVTCDDVTVVCSGIHLVIEPKKPTYKNLERATQLGLAAIASLPETPLSALGINIRYRGGETIDGITPLLTDKLGSALEDAGHTPLTQTWVKSVGWRGGTANISVTQEAGSAVNLEFNIERRSSSKTDHEGWLRIPIADLETLVNDLLTNAMSVPGEDITHG